MLQKKHFTLSCSFQVTRGLKQHLEEGRFIKKQIMYWFLKPDSKIMNWVIRVKSV